MLCLCDGAHVVHIGLRHRESCDSGYGSDGAKNTRVTRTSQDLRQPASDCGACAKGYLIWVSPDVLDIGLACIELCQFNGRGFMFALVLGSFLFERLLEAEGSSGRVGSTHSWE